MKKEYEYLKPEKIRDNIYYLEYKDDYKLDGLLQKGVKNTFQLVCYMQKIHHIAGMLRLKTGECACTTFNAFNPEDQHIFGRNFDFKEAPCLIVRTNPAKGYKSIGVADMNLMLYGLKHQKPDSSSPMRFLMAPYACMDGINEKGLCIAVLEVKAKATNQHTGCKDITTSVMIRAVLDKCASVDEAVDMFRKFDMHDALFCCYHYHIVDAYGKSVVIEYVNNEMRLLYPEDRLQNSVNYFKSPDGDNHKGVGYRRVRYIDEAMSLNGGVMTEDEAMALLDKCRLLYKHKRGYMVKTLWSAVYNCEERTMLLSALLDYDFQYKIKL